MLYTGRIWWGVLFAGSFVMESNQYSYLILHTVNSGHLILFGAMPYDTKSSQIDRVNMAHVFLLFLPLAICIYTISSFFLFIGSCVLILIRRTLCARVYLKCTPYYSYGGVHIFRVTYHRWGKKASCCNSNSLQCDNALCLFFHSFQRRRIEGRQTKSEKYDMNVQFRHT